MQRGVASTASTRSSLREDARESDQVMTTTHTVRQLLQFKDARDLSPQPFALALQYGQGRGGG